LSVREVRTMEEVACEHTSPIIYKIRISFCVTATEVDLAFNPLWYGSMSAGFWAE